MSLVTSLGKGAHSLILNNHILWTRLLLFRCWNFAKKLKVKLAKVVDEA